MWRMKVGETEYIPLVKLSPMALEIDRRDLTNRVRGFFETRSICMVRYIQRWSGGCYKSDFRAIFKSSFNVYNGLVHILRGITLSEPHSQYSCIYFCTLICILNLLADW